MDVTKIWQVVPVIDSLTSVLVQSPDDVARLSTLSRGGISVSFPQVIFHRPTFRKAMKEWTEQANIAGSPLPYFHPDWFDNYFKPFAATSSGS